jgi:hypothetical protein
MLVSCISAVVWVQGEGKSQPPGDLETGAASGGSNGRGSSTPPPLSPSTSFNGHLQLHMDSAGDWAMARNTAGKPAGGAGNKAMEMGSLAGALSGTKISTSGHSCSGMDNGSHSGCGMEHAPHAGANSTKRTGDSTSSSITEGNIQGMSLLADMNSILSGLGSTGGHSQSRSAPDMSRLATASSASDSQPTTQPITPASFDGGIKRINSGDVAAAGSLKPSISEDSLVLAQQLQLNLGPEEQEV